MLAGGPKTWARSGRQLKTIGRLARRGLKDPKAGARQARLLRAVKESRPSTPALKDPARRKDLVRGTVGGLVTGTSVNMAAAHQSKKTVSRNPQAWAEKDKKLQAFVNKGDAMPSLAEIAKGVVRKDVEPDVDPQGFLEQVERQNKVLRDSGGRFAGKVVDDIGPAVVATPYSEEE